MKMLFKKSFAEALLRGFIKTVLSIAGSMVSVAFILWLMNIVDLIV